jgi:hypothetical protein
MCSVYFAWQYSKRLLKPHKPEPTDLMAECGSDCSLHLHNLLYTPKANHDIFGSENKFLPKALNVRLSSFSKEISINTISSSRDCSSIFFFTFAVSASMTFTTPFFK